MTNQKTAGRKPPAKKPGDDVTGEYIALSNVAVCGIHFAQGDPITGITDRDQIALALRIGAIGPANGAAESDDEGDPE